jgi:septum formation protein
MGIPEIRELDRILYPLLPGTALTGGWLPLVYAVGHQDDDMNEMAALSYLLEHPETELCPETILTLFELMTEGTAMAGQGFKAENNRVASKDYFYIPVSAEKTPAAIDELCEKYGYLNHPQDDRTEDVFKFLLEFICIHPMKNGNGRLSALLVQQLARAKCLDVAKDCPNDIVIGCDTVVDVGGEVFGKPADAADARRMLQALSGRTHQVITGVCIVSSKRKYSDVSVSDVTFAPLSEEEIDGYVSSGECDDKAGAYAIQGIGGRFITHISGDYYAIMGLPLNLVYEELKNLDLY